MQNILWGTVAVSSLFILSGCSLYRTNDVSYPVVPAVTVTPQDTTVETGGVATAGTNDVATIGQEAVTKPAPVKTPPPKTDSYVPQTRTFTLTAGNYYFSPASLTVKKGDTVRITFADKEGVHGLRFDDFDTQTKTLNPGETAQFSFIASKKGNFVYYCTIHGQAMKGTLIVE